MNGVIIFGSFIIFILMGDLFLVSILAGKYESELVSLETVNDDDRFHINGNIKRISRGVYGLNLNISIMKDTFDDYTIELQIYKCPLGTDQYTKTPIGAARGPLTITEFMTEFYKPFLMASVRNCSNLPQFKDVFQPPLIAGTYLANNCQTNDDDIPFFFQVAQYKLEFILRSIKNPSSECVLRIIVKILKKVS